MNSRANFVFQLCLMTSVAVILSGCVATRPVVKIEAPPWYLQDSGAHYIANSRVFYGIGRAEGSRNMTLLRATAANRARKEMAQVLDNYVAELFQRAGAMPALTMEEGELVIGALVRKAVKQSVISDQWRSDSQTQLYVLCQLDLDAFKRVLASHALDAKARTAMMAEAENVHTALADEQSHPQ